VQILSALKQGQQKRKGRDLPLHRQEAAKAAILKTHNIININILHGLT
jgi:hypothetical protein